MGLERKAAGKGSLEKGHKSRESLEVGGTGSIRGLRWDPAEVPMDGGSKVRRSPLLSNPNPIYDSHFGQFFSMREPDFKEESGLCLTSFWRRMGSGVVFKLQSLDLSPVSPTGMSWDNSFQISRIMVRLYNGRNVICSTGFLLHGGDLMKTLSRW